jgi:hypothetical protein
VFLVQINRHLLLHILVEDLVIAIPAAKDEILPRTKPHLLTVAELNPPEPEPVRKQPHQRGDWRLGVQIPQVAG